MVDVVVLLQTPARPDAADCLPLIAKSFDGSPCEPGVALWICPCKKRVRSLADGRTELSRIGLHQTHVSRNEDRLDPDAVMAKRIPDREGNVELAKAPQEWIIDPHAGRRQRAALVQSWNASRELKPVMTL